MSYFKITHDTELNFVDNDKMTVLYQKLYDKPFRTYVYFKPKRSKSLKKLLNDENKPTVQRIPLKALKVETKGLSSVQVN